MRNFISSAMVITMALTLYSAVFMFGGVSLNLAAPAFAAVFFMVVLWGAKLFTAEAVSWKWSPMHWPVLGFVVYAFIRYQTSPLAYDSKVEFYHVLLYALVYFVAANNFYHSRERTFFVGSMLVLAVLQSGYGIWQVATGSELVWASIKPEAYAGRASGTFICPNHYAGLLEILLGLLAGRAAFFHGQTGTREKDVVRKVIIIYAALMVITGILISFSRAGWMAAILALVSLLLWGDWKLRAGWSRWIVVLGILGLIAGMIYIGPKVWNKVNRAEILDYSGGGRTFMWSATIDIVRENPIIGTGPGTWQWFHVQHREPEMQLHPVYAHSDVLHLFSDYGLVGVLLVAAFFGCFFWQVALLSNRKIKSERRSFAIGGAIGVIAILAHSWVDFNFHIPANALLVAALTGHIAAIEDKNGFFARVTLKRWVRYALATVMLGTVAALAWFMGRSALAVHHLERGNLAKHYKAWDQAGQNYERSITLDPWNPRPYHMLGDVFLDQSQGRKLVAGPEEERLLLAKRAAEYLELSLFLNPYQTEAFIRLAYAHEMLGQTNRARETFAEALALDPNNHLVHVNFGMLLRRMGEDENAAEAFEMAENLKPTGDMASRLHLEEIRPLR